MPEGEDHSDNDSTTPDADATASLAESLSAAAKRSGLAQMAIGADLPASKALLNALGGIRGLAEAILPSLVFLVLYTFTMNVPLALGSSVGIALVFTIIRVATRSSSTQAVAGLVVVGLSAILALLTGKAQNNFLFGLWLDAIYAAVFLVSILVRWPVIALVVGYLVGDGTAWRKNRQRFRAMQALTFLWLLLFVARLAVQLPLYFADTAAATSTLALVKLLMGIPLYAPLLLVTWLVVRSLYDLGPKKPDEEPSTTESSEE